jgi:type IV pilus assembly protein PilY1
MMWNSGKLCGLLIGLSILSPALGQISQLPLMPSVLSSALIYDNSALGDASIAYRASFTADAWRGQLTAYRVAPDGSIGSQLWDAADHLPGWTVRNIVTWNPEAGAAVEFHWPALTETQKDALASADILEYLRGNAALQAAQGIGNLRDRSSQLGDIVNSLPLHVKNTDFGYQSMPAAHGGGANYQDYVRAKSSRTAMLYVGANDGMLHAFDAKTGVEKFAFIPHAVFSNLKALSDPGYEHRYFVDGRLTEGDAYLTAGNGATPAWKTIVLGATGAGGKSVFALDVSTPDALGVKSVLWERSGEGPGGVTNDNDMGHLLGEAALVRLRNGQWAALYGNGYDSENKEAVLYLVNAADGSLIKKIHTEQAGGTAPNGLSTPALLFNSRREVIAAYAGDLRGNLWKFDLGDSNPVAWQVAYGGQPLFVASDRDGQVQPIVQQPVMGRHPKGGRMLMFGTGKLFEVGDPANIQVQTIYGIWEKPDGAMHVSGRHQLQLQTLTAVEGGRSISKNAIDWASQRGWYFDLPDRGERALGKPQIIDGLLVILTYAPGTHSGSANEPSSQLMVFDYKSGSAATQTIFPALPPNQISIRVPPSISSPASVSLPSGRRRLVIHALDGKTKIIDIAVAPRLPFRTWHQIPMPY